MQIKCVGQFTIDDIVLPDGTVRMQTLGGNAMYSSAGAMLWMQKNEVSPVACIGKDFPDEFTEQLSACGMNLTGLVYGSHAHMRSWIIYEENRERRCLCRNKEVLPYPPISEESFHHYFEAYRKLHLKNSPSLIDKEAVLTADAYHMAPQSYERHIENLKILRKNKADACISLDPSPFYMHRNNLSQLREILSYADIVMPSREEVFSCFGEMAPENAAMLLGDMGPAIVVIKMGADGVYIFERENRTGRRIPAIASAFTDTTGAGDAFCGGFLAGYCKTGDTVYAGCCGAVSAFYAMQDYGPGALLSADRNDARKKRDGLLQKIKTYQRGIRI